MFTAEEMQRYSRHFVLAEVGKTGQERLKKARVLCVGAGGLGSPVLLYLAAAGVGTLGIIDDDAVELSNLQRQVLYSIDDVGNSKAKTAKNKLEKLNPFINIICYKEKLTHDNALAIVQNYDVVVDGSDNFAARYVVNDACFHLKKPTVYASVYQFEGQCSVFNTEKGPCYRCLYPTPPKNLVPNCAEAGVLGVLPGMMGTLQANEVLKLILKVGELLTGQLLVVNALELSFQKFEIKRQVDCCLCAMQQPFDSLPYHEGGSCRMKENTLLELSVKELERWRQQNKNFLLLDVREEFEYQICNSNCNILQ